MQTLNVFARTSNKYRDGWSYMDNFEFVASVKLTPYRLVRKPSDYSDGGTFVQYLRVPRGMDAKVLGRAIEDTVGGSSCRHEYDCCGCTSRRVFTRLVAPRRMKVTTDISYNY